MFFRIIGNIKTDCFFVFYRISDFCIDISFLCIYFNSFLKYNK